MVHTVIGVRARVDPTNWARLDADADVLIFRPDYCWRISAMEVGVRSFHLVIPLVIPLLSPALVEQLPSDKDSTPAYGPPGPAKPLLDRPTP